MRSRMRMMFVVTGFVLVALAFFLVSAGSLTQAQGLTVTPMVDTPTPTSTAFAVDATNNSGAFFTRVSNALGLSSNSVIDIHAITDADISFDTQAALGVNCSSVVVYRETDLGDLVVHPWSCLGNTLMLKGTGGNFQVDYFVAAFGSAAAAQAAPQNVMRLNQAQSLPILGGSSSSSSSSAATMEPTMAATP